MSAASRSPAHESSPPDVLRCLCAAKYRALSPEQRLAHEAVATVVVCMRELVVAVGIVDAIEKGAVHPEGSDWVPDEWAEVLDGLHAVRQLVAVESDLVESFAPPAVHHLVSKLLEEWPDGEDEPDEPTMIEAQ